MHQKQTESVQKLEKKVVDGELVCGRLIQQYLEIGRAIELKKRHIKEDKEALAKGHKSRDDMREEIDSLTSRISALIPEWTGNIS